MKSNTNRMIALFGIDGSGKTTIIKGLGKRIKEEGGKVKVVYMGLGNEFNLPFLKTITKISLILRRRANKRDLSTWRKENYRERNFFWVFIQYSEFWIRYMKARGLSRDRIILFDRYFYDGLILGSDLSFKIFKFLTPRPDKSFLIKAPPRTIRKRKDEASIEDIQKYYSKTERLVRFFPIDIIDNSKSIEKVVGEIYKKIGGNLKEGVKKQEKFFIYLNKNKLNYAILRGDDLESVEKEKDLDILVSRKDYSRFKKKGYPSIGREIHFYPGEEKHLGISFVSEEALDRKRFDRNRQVFVLSGRDQFKMNFFRIFLKLGRVIKKSLGFYKK